MVAVTSHRAVERIEGLRAELADLAFALDSQGRRDAADVAHLLRGRLADLNRELASSASSRPARLSLFDLS